jgi:hypothetical protein
MDTACDLIFEYLPELEAVACESGAQGVLFDEKHRISKISSHCPLKETKCLNPYELHDPKSNDIWDEVRII